MIKTEVPDDYTIVVYINGTSWTYLYDLNVVIVPAHIWSNESLINQYGGWEKWDPSKVPHPTVKGLTCLIGTGPFIYKERKLGEYILLSWNPNYWRRHPSKTLALNVGLSADTLYAGDELKVTVTVKDYTGKPLPNATVTIDLVSGGTVVRSSTATHTGNGTYEATIDTSGLSGSYVVKATAVATLGGIAFTRAQTLQLTVRAAWERYLPFIAAGVIVIIAIIIVMLFLMRRRAPKETRVKEQVQ